MFTGIIQETGKVARLEPGDGGLVLSVEAPGTSAALAVGDSVAVDGCCLTAVKVEPPRFTVEAVPETLSRTAFGALREGSRVNLELPVRLTDLLGGHLVSGHVDGLGELVEDVPEGDGRRWKVRLPDGLMRYMVEKGSVALDGVSLTVAKVGPDHIEVALIPHTLDATVFSERGRGAKIHVEADLIAKHVERLLEARRGGAR